MADEINDILKADVCDGIMISPKLYKEYQKEHTVLHILKKYSDIFSLSVEFDEELYTSEEIEKEGGQKYYFEDGSDGYISHEISMNEYNLLKEFLTND